MPVEQLDAAKLDAEIRDAQSDIDAASSDEGRRLATEKLNQVQELRAALAV